MPRPLVFDATPLIYIVRGSLTEALKKIRDAKFIPENVYDEFLKGEPMGRPEASHIRELVERKEFAVTKPTDTYLVRRLIKLAAENEKKPLHAAEAEALALAKELDEIVISDDHVARSTARLIHCELHGTGYVLGRMYKEGQISRKEAITKVSEMRRAGWHLSEDDYRAILDYLRML